MKKIRKRKTRIFFKRIKFLFCIFLFFVLVFKGTMVDAGVNDSYVEKIRIDGVYSVISFMGEDYVDYLNMYTLNGIFSYCIEFDIDITNDIYNSTYDFGLSNLNSREIKYIKDVSYFGYGYKNHNDYRYYMAAQEIIWEYLSDIEVEWSSDYDVNGDRINIDSYKEAIFKLLNDYSNGVKLEGYSKDMEVVIGDTVIISDKNLNMEYYDVMDGKHSVVNVVGNDIYIKFDTDYVGNDTIILKRKKVYEHDSLLYYQGMSQKLISNGNVDDEIELSFNIKGKGMFIQLEDSVDIKHNNQFDYSNNRFELYNSSNKFVCYLDSDEFGQMYVSNLPYGTYKIVQSRYNNGYLGYSEYINQYIDFYGQDIIYLKIKPIVNVIKVLKLYGEIDNLFWEEGVFFDVYNIDGSLYDSFITDYYGVGSIKIPYGEYIVKQRNSTYGYKKVEDFYVDGRKNLKNDISFTFVDEVIKSNLIINTKDIEGNMILEDGFSYNVIKDGITIDRIISANGNAKLSQMLGYGDYTLEIIDNNDNYVSDVNSVNFSINDNSEFFLVDSELFLEIDINYELLKGNINVNTYVEDIKYIDNGYYYDYVKESNINLNLVANDDIIVKGGILYNKGDKIMDVITDNNGNSKISDIYLGSYCLVNDNYNYCFEVVDDNTIEIELKKQLEKGSVIIHNMSSNIEDIMGNVFELYNHAGDLIYTGATNEQGIIKINDLMYGEYCFKQKSVIGDYLLNKEIKCFGVDSDKMINLDFINNKSGKRLVLVPDTFSDKKSINKLFVLIIMLICGGIFYKTKVSSNNC